MSSYKLGVSCLLYSILRITLIYRNSSYTALGLSIKGYVIYI